MSGTIGKQLIRISELKKKTNKAVSHSAFVAGMFVNIVCGPIIDMAAYSFAPQSLIAPFGGLDVVWNALSAPYVLQERLTCRRAIGCFLIVIGTSCAGAFGSHEETTYTIDYLEDTLIRWRVIFYFIGFTAWFIFNVTCMMQRAPGNPIRGISLGMTGGTLAGNMWCVKASVEIVQYSFEEETGEAWEHWLPYALLLGAAFFALSNLKFMTQGLKEFEALFMVTVYEGSMIVAGSVSGAVVLQDLKDLEAYRIFLYVAGVATIVLGMAVVFSNEMINQSSYLAGTASIIREEKSDTVTRRRSRLGTAGSFVDPALVSPMATTMTHIDNPSAPVCKYPSLVSEKCSTLSKCRIAAQAGINDLTFWPVSPSGMKSIERNLAQSSIRTSVSSCEVPATPSLTTVPDTIVETDDMATLVGRPEVQAEAGEEVAESKGDKEATPKADEQITPSRLAANRPTHSHLTIQT